MAIKTFTTGEVLTAADTNTYLANSGLVFVKSQTVGSGVSSVTVADAFNASYDDYRIVISGIDCSIEENVYYLKLSGSTGSTYSSGIKWLQFTSGSINGTQLVASNLGMLIGLSGALDNTNAVLDLMQPFTTKRASMTTQSSHTNYTIYGGGIDSNAASSTGLVLVAPTNNTFTGGTITVYGYRKA